MTFREKFCRIALTFLVASVPLSGASAAEGAKVPETLPAPPEGEGQIIFWRSGSMMGGAMGCGVNLGEERISALGMGKYVILNIAPGAYEFNAKSEAKDVLNLEVGPGETQYVKCTIRMGMMVGRPNLSPSTAEEFNSKRGDLKYVDSDDLGPKALPDPGVQLEPVVEPTATPTP